MVLKECQDTKEKNKRRRRRQSTERSAGARYEVGETTDDEKPRRRRKNKKKGGDTTITDDSESDEDVTDGELEWLQKDLQTIINKEDPNTKTLKLLKDVHFPRITDQTNQEDWNQELERWLHSNEELC